jgi:mRNA interferase RelE/StbE
MAQWRVIFTIEAEEDLERLTKQVRERVLRKILWMRDNFDRILPLPLGGKWQGFFKLRVGDWRVIYEIEEEQKQITIHRIGPRDKIYKKKSPHKFK